MKAINTLRMGGAEILPLVEGGKGVSVSTGVSAGAWAAAGGSGTVSNVNADSFYSHGNLSPLASNGRPCRERHEEPVEYPVRGGISHCSD